MSNRLTVSVKSTYEQAYGKYLGQYLLRIAPEQWPEKSFKEKIFFFMERIVGSALEVSTKMFFFSHWTSTDLVIWDENSVSAIQHIGNSLPRPSLSFCIKF